MNFTKAAKKACL